MSEGYITVESLRNVDVFLHDSTEKHFVNNVGVYVQKAKLE